MMKKQGTCLFLGTGSSMGVPMIGCHCPVCSSSDPHNKRMRPSVLLKIDNKKILVDCGPDFHVQALLYHLDQLDGVILTHGHYDHTAGVDELRIYYMRSRKPLPCLMSSQTATDITTRFGYIFEPDASYDQLVTKFDVQILPEDKGKVDFLNLPIRYFSYKQAQMQVNGFRFGNLAYVTDIREYSPSIFKELEGVEVLILSALRYTPSPLHFSVDEAIEFSKKVGAKMTWLIHIAHELDHEKTNTYLPENVRMAYDGLEIDFEM